MKTQQWRLIGVLDSGVMLFPLPLIQSQRIHAHRPHVWMPSWWNTKVTAVKATVNLHLNEEVTALAIKEHNYNTEKCLQQVEKNHEHTNTNTSFIFKCCPWVNSKTIRLHCVLSIILNDWMLFPTSELQPKFYLSMEVSESGPPL